MSIGEKFASFYESHRTLLAVLAVVFLLGNTYVVLSLSGVLEKWSTPDTSDPELAVIEEFPPEPVRMLAMEKIKHEMASMGREFSNNVAQVSVTIRNTRYTHIQLCAGSEDLRIAPYYSGLYWFSAKISISASNGVEKELTRTFFLNRTQNRIVKVIEGEPERKAEFHNKITGSKD